MPRPSDDIQSRFTYHPPTPARQAEHENVRSAFLSFATRMDTILPPGREHAIVITRLDEALMWANAAIARQDDAVMASAPTHSRMSHAPRHDEGATPPEAATP